MNYLEQEYMQTLHTADHCARIEYIYDVYA